MNKSDLKSFMDIRVNSLMEEFCASEEKYQKVWAKYSQQMPSCIKHCKTLTQRLKEFDRHGPQGIYWIGKNPEIMLVGKENYGWYEVEDWAESAGDICCAPLEFTYITTESMSGFWGVIRELAADVLGEDPDNWRGILKRVAITNACKCFSFNTTYQERLHDQCSQQGFLAHEIETVGAKVNILFTKVYGFANTLFPDQTPKRLEQTSSDFLVLQYGKQVIIECHHPGRKGKESWLNNLKKIVSHYL